MTTIVIITKKFPFVKKNKTSSLFETLGIPVCTLFDLSSFEIGRRFFSLYASNLVCYPIVGMVFFRDSSLRSIYIELIKGGVRNFSEEILDEDLKTKARE